MVIVVNFDFASELLYSQPHSIFNEYSFELCVLTTPRLCSPTHKVKPALLFEELPGNVTSVPHLMEGSFPLDVLVSSQNLLVQDNSLAGCLHK